MVILLRSGSTVGRHWALYVFLVLGFVVAARPALAGTGVPLTRSWQHVLLTAPGIPDQGPFQVVAGGPGVVATDETHSHLWASADGRRWRVLRSPRWKRGEVPMWLYAAGRLLVITGSAPHAAESHWPIWTSRDAGVTWRESFPHFHITALAAGGDGLVASSGSGIWTSADGLTWRYLPQRPGVFTGAHVSTIVKSSHGLVAGGRVGPPGLKAGIWASPHGRAWKRVPNARSTFGNGRDGSAVLYMVAGPRGILAIGNRRVWASTDATHWRRAGTPFYDPRVFFGDMAAWQGGFVEFNDVGGETSVWSSANGLSWTQVPSDALFRGIAHVQSATGFQQGVVAGGSLALHPKPACVTSAGPAAQYPTFHPAVFLGNPTAAASVPQGYPADPRTLRLRPSDIGRVNLTDPNQAIFGTYVDLCGINSALGRHLAYEQEFADPDGEIGSGSATILFPGKALAIVTQDPLSAGAAFQNLGGFFEEGYSNIQHQTELPAGTRIGAETRYFRLKAVTLGENAGIEFTRCAVAWRKGRVIGLIVSGACRESANLATKQLAHLEHPF